MTSAVNILNMNNNAILSEVSSNGAATNETAEFDNILEIKTGQVSSTIGDIKQDVSNDVDADNSCFKEALIEATDEVIMENALDLTLCRDINDIIAQIHNFSVKTAESKESANEFSEKSENEAEIAVTIPMFSRVINNIGDTNVKENNGIQNNINIDLKSKDAEIETAEETQIKPESKLEKNSDSRLELSDDMISDLNIESIESEGSNAGSGMTDNGQSFEEHSMKVMLNHTDKAESFSVKAEIVDKAIPKEITSEKIIEQITKQMDTMKGSQRLSIVLNPEALGKVNIQIMNTKEGLAAHFTVASNEVRDLLMKGLDGLKETLMAQGVGVDNVSVKVSETEEAYNPDWTEQDGSTGGYKQNSQKNQEEKEKGLFEKTMEKSFDKNNGKV